MFNAALFTTKYGSNLSIHGQMNEHTVIYVYTAEYYSAFRKWDTPIHDNVNDYEEHYAKWTKLDRKKGISSLIYRIQKSNVRYREAVKSQLHRQRNEKTNRNVSKNTNL
jgi:hypothetical protein